MKSLLIKKLAAAILASTLLTACDAEDREELEQQASDVLDQISDRDEPEDQNDAADGNSDNDTAGNDSGDGNDPVVLTQLDQQLQGLIDRLDLDRSAIAGRDIPDIDSDMAQLGKTLFFSKSLGGDFDSACVTCHHPMLGGADQLTLPVGVGATNPDLLGPGRQHSSGLPEVPRNSPTVFNVALWDNSLFWDSRVESLGKEPGTNGSVSAIRTPDSAFLQADGHAGANLAAAQARFPVTSAEEMRGFSFEAGSNNQQVRDHLAARLGNYGEGSGELEQNEWLALFRQAFAQTGDAETLITFDNIAFAIGEYERSMVFVNSPWHDYVNGDVQALSESEKRGAVLFFNAPDQGGAGCAACHNGPLLSDQQHHTVAFPQIGPGKGDGANSNTTNSDDFGRERETGNSDDRYRFRTPSLLNIAQTAPYGHAGSFASLEEVVRHYVNPRRSVDAYFRNNRMCDLPQMRDIENCAQLYPNARNYSLLAANKLDQEQRNGTSRLARIRLDNQDVNDLVNFMEALTDPCITDRECMSAWIADDNNSIQENPDGQILIARDRNNTLL